MNFLDRFRTAWANFHPLLRALIVLAVLGGSVFFAAAPIKSSYHQWRNAGNLKRAQQALDNDNFAEARDSSLQILRNDGAAYEPLPILLRAMATLKDPRGVRIAAAILQNDQASSEDHLIAWAHLCSSGPTYLSLSGWSLLSEERKSSLDYQLPIIDRLLRDDMMPSAATLIAATPEPYSVELHCRLLTMLARTATDEAHDEFHRKLLGHLHMEPEAWATWLEAIDSIPQSHLHRDLFQALPPKATRPASQGTTTTLRIARCQLAAQLEDPDNVFQKVFAQYRPDEPAELARWCLQVERPDAAAECLDLDQPAQDAEDYRLQIQVLEANSQADKLNRFLSTPPASVPAWEALVRQASIAHQKNDSDLVKTSSKAALKSALERSDPTDLIELAREARARNLDDLALDAWTNALVRSTGPIPPSQSLSFVVKQLSEQKREDELFAVLDSLRFIEIGNPVVAIQYQYLSCLTGRTDAANAANAIQPLYEKHPEELPIRCTLSLALILAGKSDQAADLLDDTGIDWFATNPAYQAIRGITLAKTGRISEAEVYFEDFPWDELLPSEKRIFESLAEGSY